MSDSEAAGLSIESGGSSPRSTLSGYSGCTSFSGRATRGSESPPRAATVLGGSSGSENEADDRSPIEALSLFLPDVLSQSQSIISRPPQLIGPIAATIDREHIPNGVRGGWHGPGGARFLEPVSLGSATTPTSSPNNRLLDPLNATPGFRFLEPSSATSNLSGARVLEPSSAGAAAAAVAPALVLKRPRQRLPCESDSEHESQPQSQLRSSGIAYRRSSTHHAKRRRTIAQNSAHHHHNVSLIFYRFTNRFNQRCFSIVRISITASFLYIFFCIDSIRVISALYFKFTCRTCIYCS